MFSYCKRSTLDNTAPYEYYTSNSRSKDIVPKVCSNLNTSFVHNRGIPLDLINIDSKLRGQDSSEQPFCASLNEENGIQFSTFRDLDIKDRYQRAPIPSAPNCSSMELKNYTNDSGNNMHDLWYCNNVRKPMSGPAQCSNVQNNGKF